ncbi:hypothetical protein D6792_03960 [Candidatus Parcubacteria bacterium]|nr:MAG: hypothetical protein D6792_03960 [Candidatus Parcubacteria bacterium]GIW69062.1 MAG: hypothetical protein KatS3mg100_556 [Candidatus Parcubacteria bacterium]
MRLVHVLGFLDLVAGFTAAALFFGYPIHSFFVVGVGALIAGKGVWFIVRAHDWGSLVDVALGVVLAGAGFAGSIAAPLYGVEALVLIGKGVISLRA